MGGSHVSRTTAKTAREGTKQDVKIEEHAEVTVVTLTAEERAALHAVVAHAVPLQIIEAAETAREPVDARKLRSVVVTLFRGLQR